MPASPATARSQRGFTLIELMVTLTVMVVMLGIGVPSFKNFMATQRVKSTAFDVATALLLARSEAVKRNKAVTIAPVSAAWANGWTVHDGTTVLMTKEASSAMTITSTAASLVYLGSGRLDATADVQFELGSTVYPDDSAKRCVKVAKDGVPTTKTGPCA